MLQEEVILERLSKIKKLFPFNFYLMDNSWKTLTSTLFISAFITVIITGWIGAIIGGFVGILFDLGELFAVIGFGIAGLLTFAINYKEELEGEIRIKMNLLKADLSAVQKEKEEVTSEAQKEVERIAKKANEIITTERADKEVYKNALVERAAGYPTLLQAIEEFEEIRDREIEKYLLYKRNPSKKGAEVVKEQNQRRRKAEFELKKTMMIIEHYENLAPFLLDYKGEIDLPEEKDILAAYSEEEREDPVTQYLTKEEYRNLSTVEKNQKALDRYWSRPKTKWQIGKMYERYVGYIFEQQGYQVEYSGIKKRREDLGRDLIAVKENEIVVIQCKNWAQFKKIHENAIFQFFGTVFQYRQENRGKSIKAVFYCTNELSPLAKNFGKALKIVMEENFKMDRGYPCIKCNISRDGTKIYHLPFDQQYDNVLIEPWKGEFYCSSVREAEKAGFRRAFRYKLLGKGQG